MTIESRYKIEYIFPDESEKPSPPKALIFIPAVSLLVLLVFSVSKNYTFKDISNVSLTSVENKKEEALNLTLDNTTTLVEKTNSDVTKIPLSNSVIEDKKSTALKIKEPEATEDKITQKPSITLEEKKTKKEILATIAPLPSRKSTTSVSKAVITKVSNIETTNNETMYTPASSSTKPINFITEQETPKTVANSDILTKDKNPLDTKTITGEKQVLNIEKPKTAKNKTTIKTEDIQAKAEVPSNSNNSAVDDIIAAMKASEKK